MGDRRGIFHQDTTSNHWRRVLLTDIVRRLPDPPIHAFSMGCHSNPIDPQHGLTLFLEELGSCFCTLTNIMSIVSISVYRNTRLNGIPSLLRCTTAHIQEFMKTSHIARFTGTWGKAAQSEVLPNFLHTLREVLSLNSCCLAADTVIQIEIIRFVCRYRLLCVKLLVFVTFCILRKRKYPLCARSNSTGAGTCLRIQWICDFLVTLSVMKSSCAVVLCIISLWTETHS